MTDWFAEWFGEDYLQLYPHRDDDDAREALKLVESVVQLSGRRVLDLACGPGRHAVQLLERGARVTGLDLSAPLLQRARERLHHSVQLVRGDMRRLPFADQSFDVVVNLFTSFGYFQEEAQDLAVLGEAARTLVPGGTLVLDYFNAELVRDNLVPAEEKVLGGRQVKISRRISDTGRFVIKEIMPEGGRHFTERVRLLSPGELERLLDSSGLKVTRRFGAYDGRPLGADTPRAIFVAERPS
jgi:ubiquinone/menaquinone biosynthesis C-methylase UbiE